MCCANHPEFSTRHDDLPVGPVVAIVGDVVEVIEPSPDTPRVRDHLLEIAARADAGRIEDLTVRERMASWQLVQLAERRAFVHLDRLEANFTPAKSGSLSFDKEMLKEVFSKVAGKSLDPGDSTIPLLERLTRPGRLLLLSSIVVCALAFWGLYVLVVEELLFPGLKIPALILTIPAAVAGALYLRLGIFVFARLGIAFNAKNGEGSARGG
jgi:hypothetical protein